jgi:hypothetical protein
MRAVRVATIPALVLGGQPAFSQSDVWTGGATPTSPFWDVDTNWSLGAPPVSTDNALVGAAFAPILRSGSYSILSLQDQGGLGIEAGTLAVAATSFVDGSFSMSGGQLGGTGALTVSGPASLTGGSIGTTTSGVVTFQNNLQIAGSTTISLADATINTQGTTTWGGNTAVNGNTLSSFGITINNSGTWLDQNAFSTSLSEGCCATATFNNTGTYTKSGNSVTAFSGANLFNNTGTTNVQAGTLSLNDGTSTGTFAISSGATVQFVGGNANFNGATVTGPGTLAIAGGSLAQAGTTAQSGVLNVSSGALGVNGTWNDSGTYVQSGGTVGGSGTLTVAGPATLTGGAIGNSTSGVVTFQNALQITGSATKSLADGTINTQGTTTWGGNTAVNGNTISSFGITINNSGTWLDQNTFDTSLSEGCCATATFNNTGTYTKSGNSVTSFSGANLFNNTGTTNVQAGTLSLNDGTSTGTFAISSGATVQFVGGNANFNGAIVTGPGTLAIAGGSLAQAGTTAQSGVLNVSSGALGVNGTWNDSGTYVQSGGTVGGSGTLTVAGPATLTGGAIGNSTTGVVTFQNSLQITGSATKSIADGTINTQGTTTWGGNTAANTNAISSFGATINNSGIWLDQNTFNTSLSEGCCATTTFNNMGTYTKSGSSVTSFGGSTQFNNSGTLAIDNGSMVIGGNLSMSGSAAQLYLQITAQTNDNLQVDSAAKLGGSLDLNFDFTPTTGEIITVFDYASHTGAFASIVGTGDAAGVTLTPIYNGTDMEVVVGQAPVPLPPSVWLLGTGLLGLAFVGRQGRRSRDATVGGGLVGGLSM